MKESIKAVESMWTNGDSGPICPKCDAPATVVQSEPINDGKTTYTNYRTIIECPYCDFSLKTISRTILGCVNKYDLRHVTIAGWSDTGLREMNDYEHLLPYDALKTLKDTGELVEFLIIENHAVQIIG